MATPTTLTHGSTTYTVKATDRPQVPYLLAGPRGASYALMRNQVKPYMLFVVNARAASNTPFEWVREGEDGSLTVLR